MLFIERWRSPEERARVNSKTKEKKCPNSSKEIKKYTSHLETKKPPPERNVPY